MPALCSECPAPFKRHLRIARSKPTRSDDVPFASSVAIHSNNESRSLCAHHQAIGREGGKVSKNPEVCKGFAFLSAKKPPPRPPQHNGRGFRSAARGRAKCFALHAFVSPPFAAPLVAGDTSREHQFQEGRGAVVCVRACELREMHEKKSERARAARERGTSCLRTKGCVRELLGARSPRPPVRLPLATRLSRLLGASTCKVATSGLCSADLSERRGRGGKLDDRAPSECLLRGSALSGNVCWGLRSSMVQKGATVCAWGRWDLRGTYHPRHLLAVQEREFLLVARDLGGQKQVSRGGLEVSWRELQGGARTSAVVVAFV